MTDVELTEIAGGVRELADTELAMVAGGGFWADVAKGLGALVGRAIFGGAGGAFAGGIAVSALIAGSDTTGDCDKGYQLCFDVDWRRCAVSLIALLRFQQKPC